MPANGKLKLAIPPGHVDAFCAECKLEVHIPEGTMRCPHGEHDVHPLSLPRVPEEHRSAVALERLRTEPAAPVATVLDPASTSREAATAIAAKLAAPTVTTAERENPERIQLADVLHDWYADTRRRRDNLAAVEAGLAEELKRVRQSMRLLDGLLARIEEPEATVCAESQVVEVTAAPIAKVAALPAPPVVPAPTAEKAVAVGPFATGVNPVAGEMTVATTTHVGSAATSKPWSRAHAACINCGTSKRNHLKGGRCSRCASYWDYHGQTKELPEDRW